MLPWVVVIPVYETLASTSIELVLAAVTVVDFPLLSPGFRRQSALQHMYAASV